MSGILHVDLIKEFYKETERLRKKEEKLQQKIKGANRTLESLISGTYGDYVWTENKGVPFDLFVHETTPKHEPSGLFKNIQLQPGVCSVHPIIFSDGSLLGSTSDKNEYAFALGENGLSLQEQGISYEVLQKLVILIQRVAKSEKARYSARISALQAQLTNTRKKVNSVYNRIRKITRFTDFGLYQLEPLLKAIQHYMVNLFTIEKEVNVNGLQPTFSLTTFKTNGKKIHLTNYHRA